MIIMQMSLPLEAIANNYQPNSYTVQNSQNNETKTLSKKELRKQKKALKRAEKEEKKRIKALEREERALERKRAKEQRALEKAETKRVRKLMREQRRAEMSDIAGRDHEHHDLEQDSISIDSIGSIYRPISKPDSVQTTKPDTTLARVDSLLTPIDTLAMDTLALDSLATDSLIVTDTVVVKEVPRIKDGYLDDVLKSKNQDSMIFDMSTNMMYLYKGTEMDYTESKLSGAFMTLDLSTNIIKSIGETDSLGNYTKPKFNDRGQEYDMDSLAFNLKTRKAKISGGYRKEGEGFIHGEALKMMDAQHFNIKSARYTTCDCPEPHFYLASTKAQLIQGEKSKKIIAGPSYLVIEGVPLYPLVIPFIFFPLMSDRNSGVILPEYGEESQKGFYLRNAGYYFAFNDYVDARITAGVYTLGSWEAALASTYRVRYKYNGSFAFNYSKDIIGEQGASDYLNTNNYRLTWNHSQDPKFKPNSTFSASVNFSSSSYNKYNGNIDDYITAQTNSSISYSKTWAGKPLSFSASMQHSQNNRDSTISVSLPTMAFNVSKIFPFRRKNAVGKQRWYEKIGMSYSGTFNNSVTTKQSEFLKPSMFEDMKYGFNHQIPISTSITALNYLNITPSASYQERWYFTREIQTWNPDTKSIDIGEEQGFYRIFNYSTSVSFQTILYGMYQFKGDRAIKAIRHMMTPSFSLSYSPNFGEDKYGYYREVQSNEDGTTQTYSPYKNGIYGVPGNGENGSISFSLNNNIEMKVRSKRDTSGVAKVKVFESLNFSSSYNMLADSMKLSPISISARTTLFKSLGINASATYDPYRYSDLGVRTSSLDLTGGRITSASLSFGYSFRSVFGYEGEGSGTGSETLPRNLTADENRTLVENNINPMEAVSLLTPEYYNFSIPWNLSMNYNFTFSNSGTTRSVVQTVSYNGSITLTPKWGLSFSGGLNLETLELTPGSVSINRDLHCWQMDFTWVPVGFRKSWSFNIRVKSSILQDLKFEKSSGYLDNYY